MTRIG